MSKKVINEIISYAVIIVVAFVIAQLINHFVIMKVSSPTPSMENTIMVKDKVEVFKLAYLFGKPKRGDIVVFPAPDNPEEDYLKRIIGLPGETLEVKDGTVYINGNPLVEKYLKETPIGDFGPVDIPENSYFMMGDNRNISADAREWVNKFVTLDQIKGKAICKYPHFKWFG
jgi:signal peptidase I